MTSKRRMRRGLFARRMGAEFWRGMLVARPRSYTDQRTAAILLRMTWFHGYGAATAPP